MLSPQGARTNSHGTTIDGPSFHNRSKSRAGMLKQPMLLPRPVFARQICKAARISFLLKGSALDRTRQQR
jgi:hypothetical protein